MLITYIKGGTPAQNFLEMGSAMMRATFVIFWPKLSSFIDWCCYTQELYRLPGASSIQNALVIVLYILYKFYSSFCINRITDVSKRNFVFHCRMLSGMFDCGDVTVMSHSEIIIDYYMSFFISHVISTWDAHISPRPEGPRANMGRGLIWHVIWKMPYHNLFIIYFNASFFIFLTADRFQKPCSLIWDMMQ
jgi:hypothetical protein